MKKRDYYAILGVSHEETTHGIRIAFRRLAKRYHPDWAGEEKTREFQEIAEAYSVLSDPEARKAYHDSLEREERRKNVRGAPVRKSWPVGHREARYPAGGYGRSLLDDLLEELFGGFEEAHGRSGGGPRLFELRIVLSPEEAMRGGVLPLSVPVTEICPFCEGSGERGWDPCLFCNGHGAFGREELIPIAIPPGIEDNRVITLELPLAGHESFFLRLHIQVDNEPWTD